MADYIKNGWDGVVAFKEDLPPPEPRLGEVFLVTGGDTKFSGFYISTTTGWEVIGMALAEKSINDAGLNDIELGEFNETARNEVEEFVPDSFGYDSLVKRKVIKDITFENQSGIVLKLNFNEV